MKLLVLLLLVTGCAARKVPVGVPVYRATYAYVQTEPGEFFILVQSGGITEAKKEIGCNPCSVQYVGQAWRVVKSK